MIFTRTQRPHQYKNQRVKTSQKFLRISSSDMIEQQDLFSSFLYRDHVTRYRYEFSKLKGSKTKTCLGQQRHKQQKDLSFYTQELKLLQRIKQNRNKQLAINYKQKYKNKNTIQSRVNRISSDEQFNYEQLQKVKRKIRKQVLSLNHQFLRQYLYHQQPFNKMLVEINHYSNAGIVNQTRINELKHKIIKCMEHRKDERSVLFKQVGEEKKYQKLSHKKHLKQQHDKKIDSKFEEIWEIIEKQIRLKVKMEGQYNLCKIKQKLLNKKN